MHRTRAMTGLTADADFLLSTGELPASGIIALLVPGRVTLRAPGIPGLVWSGPVQPVTGQKVLLGIKVIPATLRDTPRSVERLQTSGLGFNQILLERLYADHAFDLINCRCAIGTVRFDEEGLAPFEKSRGDAMQ